MLTIYPAAGYDSFVSLADADGYLAAVGYADWATLADETREANLRRGTQYIFAKRLRPEYLTPLHGNILAATCEAAYRISKGVLYRDPPTGGAVKQKTVGPITIVYDTPQNDPMVKVIDDLLYGMTYSSGYGPVFLERT